MKFISLILFLFSFQSVCAQFSFGADAGLTLSTAKYIGLEAMESYQSGYYVNLSPRFELGENTRIISDLSYSQKGFQLEGAFNVIPTQFKISYLNLSPKIEYRLMESLGIGAGVYVGWRINQIQKLAGIAWERSKISAKSFDLGISSSLRYYLDRFNFNVAYEYGLTDVSNFLYTDQNGQPIGNSEVFNRSFKFGIGYLFLN